MAKQGSLRERVEALEAELARIKARLGEAPPAKTSWVDQIWGTFANDPIYDEAMRLGREYLGQLGDADRARRHGQRCAAIHGCSERHPQQS